MLIVDRLAGGAVNPVQARVGRKPDGARAILINLGAGSRGSDRDVWRGCGGFPARNLRLRKKQKGFSLSCEVFSKGRPPPHRKMGALDPAQLARWRVRPVTRARAVQVRMVVELPHPLSDPFSCLGTDVGVVAKELGNRTDGARQLLGDVLHCHVHRRIIACSASVIRETAEQQRQGINGELLNSCGNWSPRHLDSVFATDMSLNRHHLALAGFGGVVEVESRMDASTDALPRRPAHRQFRIKNMAQATQPAVPIFRMQSSDARRLPGSKRLLRNSPHRVYDVNAPERLSWAIALATRCLSPITTRSVTGVVPPCRLGDLTRTGAECSSIPSSSPGIRVVARELQQQHRRRAH